MRPVPTNTVQHDARRVSRAMAALRFTGERTQNRWLTRLCRMKFTEAAALEKLDSCGYTVTFNREQERP